jgi:hypothetical protein
MDLEDEEYKELKNTSTEEYKELKNTSTELKITNILLEYR